MGRAGRWASWHGQLDGAVYAAWREYDYPFQDVACGVHFFDVTSRRQRHCDGPAARQAAQLLESARCPVELVRRRTCISLQQRAHPLLDAVWQIRSRLRDAERSDLSRHRHRTRTRVASRHARARPYPPCLAAPADASVSVSTPRFAPPCIKIAAILALYSSSLVPCRLGDAACAPKPFHARALERQSAVEIFDASPVSPSYGWPDGLMLVKLSSSRSLRSPPASQFHDVADGEVHRAPSRLVPFATWCCLCPCIVGTGLA